MVIADPLIAFSREYSGRMPYETPTRRAKPIRPLVTANHHHLSHLIRHSRWTATMPAQLHRSIDARAHAAPRLPNTIATTATVPNYHQHIAAAADVFLDYSATFS
jgi:hypothetical protein